MNKNSIEGQVDFEQRALTAEQITKLKEIAHFHEAILEIARKWTQVEKLGQPIDAGEVLTAYRKLSIAWEDKTLQMLNLTKEQLLSVLSSSQ